MRSVYTLLILITSFVAEAQIPENDILLIKERFTPEGLYFHFDKDIYISGETIWFKSYVTESGLPSSKSTVICVELLNDSAKIINKKILPVIASAAIGEFDLPIDLRQGNYIVRAYTQRLLSFGNVHFYEKNIQIINPYNALSKKDSIIPQLSFLPEGGNMIADLPAVVAFKANDQFGNPIEVKGQILDEENFPVIDFGTKHQGMGKFIFIPQPGKKYYATYDYNRKKMKVALPAVAPTGASLNIQLNENSAKFIINTTKLMVSEMQPAYLLGLANNEVVFKVDLSASINKMITGEIPVQNISPGILQLTLFTSEHKPLAERMLFINHEDLLLKTSFTTDTLSFKAFQKNKFSLSISDTIAGTYSLSVTDKSKDLPLADKENIISRILLQNNIKGHVYNAIDYFIAPFNFTKQQQLDLVMLTSGWRRYNWDEILNKKLPVFPSDKLNYISFKCRFFEKDGKTPLSKKYVSLHILSSDSANEFFRFTTDSAGLISINGMIFSDTAKFIFQNTSNNSKPEMLPLSKSINEYFRKDNISLLALVASLPKESPVSTLALAQSTSLKKSYDEFKLMDEVRLKNSRKINKTKIVEDRYATGLFSTGNSRLYDFINNPTSRYYRNVFEYLKLNAVGINVSGDGFNYFVNFRMTRSLMGGLIPADLFLDGFKVDASYLASIPLQEVALIKTYSTGFAGSEGGGIGGAVAVFTRKGNDIIAREAKDRTEIKVEGFSPTKEFFNPEYLQYPTGITDKRSTLYWNPYLNIPSGQSIIHIPFYNAENDIKEFRIVITGINAEGKLLYFEKIIQ